MLVSGRVSRNPAIRLFEGADPTAFVWKHLGATTTAEPDPDYSRATTTIFFTPPIPPQAPFQPIRLPAAPRRQS